PATTAPGPERGTASLSPHPHAGLEQRGGRRPAAGCRAPTTPARHQPAPVACHQRTRPANLRHPPATAVIRPGRPRPPRRNRTLPRPTHRRRRPLPRERPRHPRRPRQSPPSRTHTPHHRGHAHPAAPPCPHRQPHGRHLRRQSFRHHPRPPRTPPHPTVNH